jgi:hypothetical protein
MNQEGSSSHKLQIVTGASLALNIHEKKQLNNRIRKVWENHINTESEKIA